MTRMTEQMNDRRQRAMRAYHAQAWGRVLTSDLTASAARSAVDTATRVQITDEMIDVFGQAWHEAQQDGPPGTRRRAALRAAFEAAGFEIVED